MSKTTITNISTGARGARTKDGALVMLEPGESAEGEFEADLPEEWFETAKPAAKGKASEAKTED
jgi:hypothetical protein